MRILIAEDEPAIRLLLEEMLTLWGYEVVAAQDGNEAYQILQSANAPNIAILDWMMPGFKGVEISRKVRKDEKDIYTYIIILTALNSDEDIVCGMDAGADDYIVKPFSLNELRGRINAGSRIIKLNQELLEARKALQVKATHDSLTGLLNHEEILDILSKELTRSERDGECCSVIMADIDHFKMVNDTYGHLAGDEVLRKTANNMHYFMRTYDTIARYGGEEFLIVLPECCTECAAAFAERLRSRVSRDKINTLEGQIPVTISLGVATYNRKGKLNVLSLVKAADSAMYRAKMNGRNRVEMADVIADEPSS
jgi:diguanylate cyclase (GGDEF)-like protein